MKKSEASKETQKTASAEKKVKKDRPGVRARRKKKTHRILIWIGMILSILLVVSGVLLVALARWVFATWNGLKMDEVIYHINAPIEGTGGDMIASGIVNCVIPAGLAGLFYTAALLIYRRRRRVRKYLVRIDLLPHSPGQFRFMAVGTAEIASGCKCRTGHFVRIIQ